MKSVLIALTLLLTLASVSVSAQETTQQQDQNRRTTELVFAKVATMTPMQREELLKSATEIESGKTAAQTTREWVDIGSSLGDALASTASKLGVAVNDFAKSPVGILAIALILWNQLGETIIHLSTAALLFGPGLMLWFIIFRRAFGVFNEHGKLVSYDLDKQGDTVIFASWVVGIVIVAAGLLALLTAG